MRCFAVFLLLSCAPTLTRAAYPDKTTEADVEDIRPDGDAEGLPEVTVIGTGESTPSSQSKVNRALENPGTRTNADTTSPVPPPTGAAPNAVPPPNPPPTAQLPP